MIRIEAKRDVRLTRTFEVLAMYLTRSVPAASDKKQQVSNPRPFVGHRAYRELDSVLLIRVTIMSH